VQVAAAPETMLKANSDLPFSRTGPIPPDWSEFVLEVGPIAFDVVIAKKQWEAFTAPISSFS